MNRRIHHWRTVLVFVMALHFIFIAPVHAFVPTPKKVVLIKIVKVKAFHFRTQWSVKEIARQRASTYGWDKKQFACLTQLWNQESHWNPKALNRSSGAYGIAQALPPDKMDVVATDWRTNYATQIIWGERYIAIRYSTPCNALRHEYNTGYY